MRLQLPLMCVPSVGVSVLWPLQRYRAYDRIHWNRYTPQIHQIQKPKFLGSKSNQTKISIEFLDFGEFRRRSIFSGNCNLYFFFNALCVHCACMCVHVCVCVCVLECIFACVFTCACVCFVRWHQSFLEILAPSLACFSLSALDRVCSCHTQK